MTAQICPTRLTLALLLAAAVVIPASLPVEAAPPIIFTHGVASGDVTPFSAVIWTRVPYSRWEGYAAERAELIRFIRFNNIENVVFLSTDDHRNLIHQVFVDRLTEPQSAGTEFVTGPVAFLTDQGIVLNFFGLSPDTDCSLAANAALAGCRAVAAGQAILSFSGVSCRHLNRYSYGVVDVDAGGTAVVTLKDQWGQIIHDQLNPAIACSRGVGP